MSPKNAWVDAFAVLVITVVCLGLCGDAARSLAIADSAGVAAWLLLWVVYVRMARSTHGKRSARRTSGDGSVLRAAITGFVLPGGLAWATVALHPIDSPISGGDAVTAITLLIVAPVVVFVSTLCDWYVVRPFRDGVLSEPASPTCRPPADDDVGKRDWYAQFWVGHRGLAELLGYGGVLVFLLISLVYLQHDSKLSEAVLGYVGLTGVVNVIVARQLLVRVWPAFRYITSGKPPGLGTWVRGVDEEGRSFEGFVLDVSLDGLQVIRKPKGYQPTGGDSVLVPLSRARKLQAVDPPKPLCMHRCEGWIRFDECERHQRETDATKGLPPAPKDEEPVAAARRGP